MAPALKVFRTPIGFHDAYVAAPSQKAALEAWGADANLFARGAAERVTDPELMAEPLAKPGMVIKRRRASAAEHFASLGATDASSAPRARRSARAKAAPQPQAQSRPRPSRAALDAAEQALADQQRRAANDIAALEEQAARIREEIRQLRRRQEKEAAQFDRHLQREREKYEAALERWRTS